MEWRDGSLHDASKDYASAGDADFNHAVADQFYYFIRDVSHHHQHHSPDTDTLITVQPSRGQDLSWARAIIYALYYHIMTRKRYRADEDQARALGILAYLLSFKSIVNAKAEALGINPNVPSFDDDALKESIRATKDHVELLNARRRARIETSRNVVLGSLVVLLGSLTFMISFADPEGPISPIMRGAADYIRQYAELIFPLLILLAIAYFSVGMFDWTGRKSAILRDAVRLAVATNKWVWFTALISAGAIFIYLALRQVYHW